MPRVQKMMIRHIKKTAALIGLLLCMQCSETGKESGNIAANECGICHGIPPSDSNHIVHVERNNFACRACHLNYGIDPFYTDAVLHGNGDTDVVFAQIYSDSGRAFYDKGLKQCSNVYCHGAFVQGTRASVSFGIDTINGECSACHDLQLLYAGHGQNNEHIQGFGDTLDLNECSQCHPGYSLYTSTVNEAQHIDGVTKATEGCEMCHSIP